MVLYDGLNEALAAKGLNKSDLTGKLGLSSRTVAKIAKGEKLSKRTVHRIAEFLGVDDDAIIREVSDNRILQILRDEKEMKLSGGLYHELQVRMTYNSNHIEGSQLTENQTRRIFETRTVDTGHDISVDDILETVHHFRAVDYVIDTAETPLSEKIIKHPHFLLKHDTKDALLPWFAVGDYKKRANLVGGRETAKPAEVPQKMRDLLEAYHQKTRATIHDIIEFHAHFEQIHPFQDGNGRIGRLIALKECLRHHIIPFIIEDRKKQFYYRGLAEWSRERGWLTDTCLDAQDTFKRLLDQLEIPYEKE